MGEHGGSAREIMYEETSELGDGGLLDVSAATLRDLRDPAKVEPAVLDRAIELYLKSREHDTEPSAGFNARI
jgi:hypothetical protein